MKLNSILSPDDVIIGLKSNSKKQVLQEMVRHVSANVEGFDQRLRQREARRLDDDMIRRFGSVQQFFHGRQEIVGDGAADAAVGQFDDVVILTPFDPAVANQFAIDTQIAEFVDDEGKAAAAGPLDHVADQAGLTGAEKTGDDGGGDLAGGKLSGGRGHGASPHIGWAQASPGVSPRPDLTPDRNERRRMAGLLACGSKLRTAFPI